jgi:hypothetical protein
MQQVSPFRPQRDPHGTAHSFLSKRVLAKMEEKKVLESNIAWNLSLIVVIVERPVTLIRLGFIVASWERLNFQ